MLEEFERFLDRHVQHIVDALPPVFHFQRLAVVSLSVAHFTRNIDIRQEVHLDLHDAVALTCLAAPALHIE